MISWTIWVIIGIALCIWEIFTPGFFVASVGLGAFCAAIVSALGGSLTLQIIALIFGLVVSMLVIRPLLYKKWIKGKDSPTGVQALIGKKGIVEISIDNEKEQGRVTIGGESWRARSSEKHVIDEGTSVIIDSVLGATLYVSVKKGE